MPKIPAQAPSKKRGRPPKLSGDLPRIIPEKSPSESAGPPENETLFPEAVSGVHRIRVSRLDDFSKKEVLHGYLTTDEQTESRVAELWGGGSYKIFLIGPDDTGAMVYRRKREFSILGAYKRPAEIYGLQGTTPAVSSPPVPVPNALLAPSGRLSINETLDQLRLQQVLDIVKDKRDPSPASGVPWEKFLDIGLRIAEMFANRKEDPSASLREDLRRLEEKLSRPATGPVTSGVEDMAKAISAILDIKERISDPTGGGGVEKNDGFMSMATDLVRTLVQQQAQGGQVPGPASRIPGKVEVPAVPVPAAPVPSPLPMWQQLLRHAKPQLLEAARFGFDPGSIADMAAAKLPAEMRGVAEEFLRRPDAAIVAVQEIPELAEFATWNATFWAEFKTAVLGDDAEEEAPG